LLKVAGWRARGGWMREFEILLVVRYEQTARRAEVQRQQMDFQKSVANDLNDNLV